MNNDFKLLKKVKEYIFFLESVLNNYPKKDYIAKNIIYETSLDILYLVLKANYESDFLVRRDYQKEMLTIINMLDFYLERSYKFKYISDNQLKKNSAKLTEITKMVYGWIKTNGPREF